MMSYRHLPDELWSLITGNLAPQDVKALRLVNKRLASIGLDFMTHELNMIFSPASMRRLVDISCHPVLRRNVRSIKLSLQILPKISRRGWARPLKRLEMIPRDITQCRWGQYDTFMADQRQMLESGAFVMSVKQSLARLPRLNSLKIDVVAFAEGCHPPDCAPLFESRDSTRNLRYFSGDGLALETLIPKLLPQVLSSLGQASSTLSVLETTCFHWKLFSAAPAVSAAIIHMMASLRVINISYPITTELYEHETFNENLAKQFLGAAPHLETIRVRFWSDDAAIPTELKHTQLLLNNHTWPNLKHLEVTGMIVDSRHMLDVFRRHRATLRRVDLNHIHLCAGVLQPWTQFLKQAKDLINFDVFQVAGNMNTDYCYFAADQYLTDLPFLSIGAAIRYLMCGKKKPPEGRILTAAHITRWDRLTWADLERRGL